MDVQTSAGGGGDPGIDFVYTIKEQAFEQYGNTAPTTPTDWGFGSGVLGGSNVTGGSVSYGEETELFSGSDGEYELDIQGYASQAALDADYPNGDFTVTVTVGGDDTVVGPFPITGNAYPPAPHITNAVELQSHDYTQDYLLTWDAFSGADAGDEIILQIWDSTTDDDIVFARLDPTATSYLISGDELSADKYYDIDLLFLNETYGPESPDTLIGYLSSTTFYLSTHTSDTELAFYKWKRNQQTAPGVIQEDGYRQLTTVRGESNTVTYAELNTPAGPYNLGNSGNNFFLSITPWGTKEVLDAAYPIGEYSFWIEENASFILYGPYNLPEDAYPTAPEFQNFNELQSFDSTQAQTITWSSTPAGVSLINVRIIDESNTQVWGTGLAPGTTTTELPANTLDPDTNYTLIVRFWSEEAGSDHPAASLGYVSATYMNVQTSAGGGGDLGTEFIYTVKLKEFEQYGNMAPETPLNWGFGAGVNLDGATGATISYPGSGGFIALPGEPGSYELDDENNYNSQAELNAAYPEGDITLNITLDGSPNEVVGPFTITGDAYPNTPHILNAVALQSHDYTQDFTVMWNSFDGSVEGDRVIFQVWDNALDKELYFEFLDRSETSFLIPGGTLEENKSYDIEVIFAKGTYAGPETPETIIGYLSITKTEISTWPQFVEDPDIWLSRGITAEQTSATIPTSGKFHFLAEASGAGFSSATLIKPDTGEVVIPAQDPMFAPGEFELDETYNDEVDRDNAYPEGDYSVRIVDNGTPTTHGPFALSGVAVPIIPGVTNWDDAQTIDPDQDFTLNWTPFSNAGDEAFIELELWNNSVPENEMSLTLASDSGALLLSSDFLQPNSTYSGEIIFVNPTIAPQTSSGVFVNAVYEVFTTFTIQTGDGGDPYAIWLSQHFTEEERLNVDIVGEGADPDGDDLDNNFEFLAKLDPSDRNSKLRYSYVGDPNQSLTISPVYPGVIFEILSSSDLVNWNTVGPAFYETVGDELQIDLQTFLPSTFFRVVLSDGE
jgi:hypothetical protein